MDRYNKIRILLRLADLCTPDESERRNKYMDKIDNLLYDHDLPISTTNDDITDLFDFDAPKGMWQWVLVSELLHNDCIQDLCCYTYETLGRRLSGMVNENYGIRKKHGNKGTHYFLPPLKEYEKENEKESMGGFLYG